MMLAPDKTNLMAPRSTPTFGSMPGSVWHGQRLMVKICQRGRSVQTRLAFVQDPQSRVIRSVEMLEEQWFAVECKNANVFSAGV